MKINSLAWLRSNLGETMARFGDARLVKQIDGKIELIGGSPHDRRTAREWCSLFLHAAVVGSGPGSRSRIPTS